MGKEYVYDPSVVLGLIPVSLADPCNECGCDCAGERKKGVINHTNDSMSLTGQEIIKTTKRVHVCIDCMSLTGQERERLR